MWSRSQTKLLLSAAYIRRDNTFSMTKVPYLPGEPHQPVSFPFPKNSIKKVCGACRHVATPHKLMLHLPHCTFALSLQWHPRGSMRPEVLDSICDISSHPFSFSPPPSLEAVWLEIWEKKNRRALIGAIYCPPSSDSRLMFLESLYNCNCT